MDIKKISPFLSVSSQLSSQDLGAASACGYRSIINNRPDGEDPDQPTSDYLQQIALSLGLEYRHIPVTPGQITEDNTKEFKEALAEIQGPAIAFCRTGSRSITLWALSQANHLSSAAILSAAEDAGYDLSHLRQQLDDKLGNVDKDGNSNELRTSDTHDVVIIGGGAAGIATASSLLKRQSELDIAIIEPSEHHFYQPGWTLVGGGVFDRCQTERKMESVIPDGTRWIRGAAAEFAPERNEVILEDGQRIGYKLLVVAPGIKLNWDAIAGLRETLGKNGVTSNYLFDMAPYTWELINNLKNGKALFTQPTMPIKCAGAPQKAMYMACSEWYDAGSLENIDVSFHNSGGVLFGVEEYVPALMDYVDKYDITLNFNETLVEIDSSTKTAIFEVMDKNETKKIKRKFDMIHVCPPQTSPDFIKSSPLSDDDGWIDVNSETLQHVRYGNIFSVGDACSAPNAKTAAAVRKQAPIVAENICAILKGKPPAAMYTGYGSCPLTVERGKVVLAEFSYGGKLEPTFPTWLLNGTRPSRLAWFLKEKMMPMIYFDLMLKGREWLVKPALLTHPPAQHDVHDAILQEPDEEN